MSLPLAILALALVGLIVGTSFVIGGPILAVPILLLLPGPFVALSTLRRQRRLREMRRFREQAQAHKTPFTPEDRRTVV